MRFHCIVPLQNLQMEVAIDGPSRPPYASLHHCSFSRMIFTLVYILAMGVWIRWNGAVEWNGGMDYWNGILECPTYYRASLKSFVIAERRSTARRTAYNVSGSYIGGTLVLLRATIGIICWTEMGNYNIVISCAWHTALGSYH